MSKAKADVRFADVMAAGMPYRPRPPFALEGIPLPLDDLDVLIEEHLSGTVLGWVVFKREDATRKTVVYKLKNSQLGELGTIELRGRGEQLSAMNVSGVPRPVWCGPLPEGMERVTDENGFTAILPKPGYEPPPDWGAHIEEQRELCRELYTKRQERQKAIVQGLFRWMTQNRTWIKAWQELAKELGAEPNETSLAYGAGDKPDQTGMLVDSGAGDESEETTMRREFTLPRGRAVEIVREAGEIYGVSVYTKSSGNDSVMMGIEFPTFGGLELGHIFIKPDADQPHQRVVSISVATLGDAWINWDDFVKTCRGLAQTPADDGAGDLTASRQQKDNSTMPIETERTEIIKGKTLQDVFGIFEKYAYRAQDPAMLVPIKETGRIVVIVKQMHTDDDDRRVADELHRGTLKAIPDANGVRIAIDLGEFPDRELFWRMVDDLLVKLGVPADSGAGDEPDQTGTPADDGATNSKVDDFETRQDRLDEVQPTWNRPIIRGLLTAAFNDTDLTALCFDHFVPVYEKFADGMTKNGKVQALLDYCFRHYRVDELLKLIKEHNPAQYSKFEKQLKTNR